MKSGHEHGGMAILGMVISPLALMLLAACGADPFGDEPPPGQIQTSDETSVNIKGDLPAEVHKVELKVTQRGIVVQEDSALRAADGSFKLQVKLKKGQSYQLELKAKDKDGALFARGSADVEIKSNQGDTMDVHITLTRVEGPAPADDEVDVNVIVDMAAGPGGGTVVPPAQGGELLLYGPSATDYCTGALAQLGLCTQGENAACTVIENRTGDSLTCEVKLTLGFGQQSVTDQTEKQRQLEFKAREQKIFCEPFPAGKSFHSFTAFSGQCKKPGGSLAPAVVRQAAKADYPLGVVSLSGGAAGNGFEASIKLQNNLAKPIHCKVETIILFTGLDPVPKYESIEVAASQPYTLKVAYPDVAATTKIEGALVNAVCTTNPAAQTSPCDLEQKDCLEQIYTSRVYL